ncbi:hypothetical protein [Streptomyces sp. NPDC005244]|uniref:hypothetical protein n=1 Tax=Streptomyces sp. NPDC005244 TaxID=3364708 RepID=UPI0036AF3C89
MFHHGMTVLRPRYAALGLRDLLPLERVMVGSASQRAGAFGGFHHPNQGYRHLQMRALITMYGDMRGDVPTVPELAVLDLLRAYAHDCLHYGSCRRYLMRGGEVVRTQYGINYRQPNGRTYSAPDVPGSPTTRNIGTVMEGACDREARSITRQVAAAHGVEYRDGVDGFAFRDVTGQLDSRDKPTGGTPETAKYVTSMLKYEAGVNARYAGFLDEMGQSESDALHDVILSAIISGDLAELCAWLDARHGPGTFAALFMSRRYLSPDTPEAEFRLAS